MTIFGIDASDFDWQRGPMDVAAMARDGITFLTHKATEGTHIQHAHYGEALNRARAAGVPFIGAYMVPRTPGNNGHGTIAQQVAYLFAYLDAATPWWRGLPTFFIQVDTEHWGYDDVSPALGAQACALIRAQTGKWVVHYAPRWAYGDTIPGTDPLWASAYGTNPTTGYRQSYPGDGSSGWTPYSGRTPTFLQYGSKLTIGGQPGCDANAYRGTIEELHTLITGGQDVTPDESRLLANTEHLLTQWGQGADTVTVDYGAGNKPTLVNPFKKLKDELLAALPAPAPAPVALTDADRAAIVDAVVSHPDTPLSDADKPAIEAALGEFFAAHFPAPAPAPVKWAAMENPTPALAEPVNTVDPDNDGDPATGTPGTAPVA